MATGKELNDLNKQEDKFDISVISLQVQNKTQMLKADEEEEKQRKPSTVKNRTWTILLASFCFIGMVQFAAQFTVVFVELLDEFEETHAKTSLVESVNRCVFFGSAIISGIIVKVFGVRSASCLASLLVAFGFSVNFFAFSITFMVITVGIFCGFGFSLCNICAYSSIRNHFVGTKLIVATSLVSVCAGVLRMCIPLLSNYLIELYNFRGAFLIMGAISLHGIPAALISKQGGIETPKAKNNYSSKYSDKSTLNEQTSSSVRQCSGCIDNYKKKDFKDLKNGMKILIKNKVFVIYGIGMVISIVSINTFYAFVIDFYRSLGLDRSKAVFMLFILNLCSIFARFTPGLIKCIPHMSVISVSIMATATGCITLLLFPHVDTEEYILILSCVMGIAIGGMFSSTYATINRILDCSNSATGLGLVLSVCGVGVISSIPISGISRDVTGSYILMCYTIAGSFACACVFFIFVLILRNHSGKKKRFVLESNISLDSNKI